MGSPMALSNLTLSDLERSNSKSLIFQSLTSRKEAQLVPVLLLNINRNSYMGSPIRLSHLSLSGLQRSKSWFELSGWTSICYTYICQQYLTLIWMSHKVVCQRAGFFAVPVVCLVHLHISHLQTYFVGQYCCPVMLIVNLRPHGMCYLLSPWVTQSVCFLCRNHILISLNMKQMYMI